MAKAKKSKKSKKSESVETDAPNVSAALARAFANVTEEAAGNTEVVVENVEVALESVEAEVALEAATEENSEVATEETLGAEGEGSEASLEAVSEEAPAEGEAAAPVGDGTKVTDFSEIEQAVEALIFASTRSISLIRLKNALNHFNYDVGQLGDVLKSLEQKYENAGFQLVKVGHGYQFRSNPKQSDLLQRILEDKPAKLGTSALEVLAIVAYKQPVTRAEIDAVRGTDSGHLMKGLLEKNLVRSVGHAETVGRPLLYGTSGYFLEVFGLNSLDDLPATDEYVRELGPDSDAAPGSDGEPVVLAADGSVASEADALFFDRQSPLSAVPDRGAFDEPAEDRFETPDFGEADAPEAKA